MLIRFKEVKSKLDQQYELLRLIVSKMEIKDEADQLDEGCSRSSKGLKSMPSVAGSMKERGWLKSGTLAKVKAVAAVDHHLSKDAKK